MLDLTRPLIVFDIESTGLFPRRDRIIELACIKVLPDGTEIEKCWLMNPTVPIPPETTQIHGITNEMVKDCPTFRDNADEIFAFFDGCDLSGFNADRYDIPCLEEEFARVGRNFALSARRRIDVQRIYHRMEPRDLTAAVRFYLGRDHAGAHGAEADARATLASPSISAPAYTTDGAVQFRSAIRSAPSTRLRTRGTVSPKTKSPAWRKTGRFPKRWRSRGKIRSTAKSTASICGARAQTPC